MIGKRCGCSGMRHDEHGNEPKGAAMVMKWRAASMRRERRAWTTRYGARATRDARRERPGQRARGRRARHA